MLLAQAHAVCLVSACIGMLLWYLHRALSHFVLRIAQTKNSHPALASSCLVGVLLAFKVLCSHPLPDGELMEQGKLALAAPFIFMIFPICFVFGCIPDPEAAAPVGTEVLGFFRRRSVTPLIISSSDWALSCTPAAGCAPSGAGALLEVPA